MKRHVFRPLALAALLTLLPLRALAAKEWKPQYTLKGGVAVQDEADRGSAPGADTAARAAIEGERPVTGLPLASGRYLPMLVQVDNGVGKLKQKGKTREAAGIGSCAPWGLQHADVVYEELLYAGMTRLTCLFSDSFARGEPTSVGPVRSLRTGLMRLREEWQSAAVFAGGLEREEFDVTARFQALQASGAGLALNLFDPALGEYKGRVMEVRAPSNMNVALVGLRRTIPDTTLAEPRPRLFFDECLYDYARADGVALDWGRKETISRFEYDAATGRYLWYSGDSPHLSYASAEARAAETEAEQLGFENVVVQRVTYDLQLPILPDPALVGRGNAEFFIGGRYVPGYWTRADFNAPTIYWDDQGNELRFARGQTYIAHFPPECLLTYAGK